MLRRLRSACFTGSLLCLAPSRAVGQHASVDLRLPHWSSPDSSNLTVPEQRAVLAPPAYWFGAEFTRVAVERSPPMWGDALFVDWVTSSGTGISENTVFVAHPEEDRPPLVAWKGISEAHFYGNDGRLQEQVRTCLYLLADTSFAYVTVHDPHSPLMTIWDSVPPAAVYRLGPHSNGSEPRCIAPGRHRLP